MNQHQQHQPTSSCFSVLTGSGTRCACINAACLAIIDAGIPMRDFVVACAAGYYDKTPLVDLNFYEDSSGSPDMPVAIFPKSGTITMLQMDSKLHTETFESVSIYWYQVLKNRLWIVPLTVVKRFMKYFFLLFGQEPKN